MRLRYAVAFSALVIILAHSAQAQLAWQAYTPLMTARSFHNARYIGNNKVLVMGGLGYGVNPPSALSSCELIDLGTRSVSPAPPMAAPRAEFVDLLTPDSNIVVISGLAGRQDHGILTPLVELYDRNTGTWRTLGQLQTARRQHAAAFINDHEILVVGGRHQNHDVMADAEIFDITTGTSRKAASFPLPINLASMGYSSTGDLCVVGGRDGGANSPRSDKVYRYDIARDAWVLVSKIAAPIDGATILKLWDGRLMISGGSRQEMPPDLAKEVQIENANMWSVLGMMGNERTWHAAAQWNIDSVMTIGGFDNSSAMRATTDWVDLRMGTVTCGPSLKIARSYFQAVTVPGCIDRTGRSHGTALLAIGGRTGWDFGTPTVEILEECNAIDVDCGSNAAICQGTAVPLGGNPTASGAPDPFLYNWQPAAGLSCTDCPNPVATPAVTTTYYLTVTGLNGQIGRGSVTVNVHEVHTVHAHTGGTLAGAPGDTLELRVELDDPADIDGVNDVTISLSYEQSLMLHVPQEPAELTAGTLLNGWNIAIVKDAPGMLVVHAQAPPGVLLSGTGTLLRSRMWTFMKVLASANDHWNDHGTVTCNVEALNAPCMVVKEDSAVVHLAVCGLNLRLIEIAEGMNRLEPNYPNPFNPSTEITYSVAFDGHATLVVMNAEGREVARLVDGDQHAGRYGVTWDATAFPSGLYYYRLTTDSWSATRGMVLVK